MVHILVGMGGLDVGSTNGKEWKGARARSVNKVCCNDKLPGQDMP